MKTSLTLLTALLLPFFVVPATAQPSQAPLPTDSSEIVLYSDTASFETETDTVSTRQPIMIDQEFFDENIDQLFPFFGTLVGGMGLSMLIFVALILIILPLGILLLVGILLYRLVRNSGNTPAGTTDPRRRVVTLLSTGTAMMLIDLWVLDTTGLFTIIGIVLLCLGAGGGINLWLDRKNRPERNDSPEEETNK